MPDTELLDRALEDVRRERERQDAKWGAHRRQPYAHWLAILTEEVGEAAERTCALEVGERVVEPSTRDDLRAELVQVAASATAWIEAIDDDR